MASLLETIDEPTVLANDCEYIMSSPRQSIRELDQHSLGTATLRTGLELKDPHVELPPILEAKSNA